MKIQTVFKWYKRPFSGLFIISRCCHFIIFWGVFHNTCFFLCCWANCLATGIVLPPVRIKLNQPNQERNQICLQHEGPKEKLSICTQTEEVQHSSLRLTTTISQVSVAHTLPLFEWQTLVFLKYTLLHDLAVSRTFFSGTSGNLFSFSLLTSNDR